MKLARYALIAVAVVLLVLGLVSFVTRFSERESTTSSLLGTSMACSLVATALARREQRPPR